MNESVSFVANVEGELLTFVKSNVSFLLQASGHKIISHTAELAASDAALNTFDMIFVGTLPWF